MKREKKRKEPYKINHRQLAIFAVIILAMAVLTILSLAYVGNWVGYGRKINAEPYETFERHYAFIADSEENIFWEKVYEEAKAYAKEENVYLEWEGSGITADYSKTELLRIAVASQVDGIILEGDGSAEIQEAIDKAVDQGIPVVTVMTDSYDSKRQSFIGIGNHNLGREYGRQIIRVANKNTKDALILMDTSMESSGKNLVYNGIRETLDNEGNHLGLELKTMVLNQDSPFGKEEAIREIFLNKEKLPEIIICLNEKDTISTYQAAVDYNLVGEIKILGYSDADTILNGISRNVIAATIAVDAKQVGDYCVKALDEYIETGHVNDFFTMDVDAVTPNNVKGRLKDAVEKDEE